MEVNDLKKKKIWKNLYNIFMYFENYLGGYIRGFLICMFVSTIFNSVCNDLGASLDFSKDGILLFLTSVRNLSVSVAIFLFSWQMASLVWWDTDCRQLSYISRFFRIVLKYLGFFVSLESFIRLFSENFRGIYGRSDLSVFLSSEFEKDIVVLGVIIVLLPVFKKVCKRNEGVKVKI